MTSVKPPTPSNQPEKIKWRTSSQIAGVRAQLKGAINCCDNGAQIELDIRTARNLLEICDQAIHTERGHDF
jgi:hypothetical protein